MPTQQIERRAFAVTELRAEAESRVITGHAAVFRRISEDLGGFREQIEPGAFRQTIAEDDIRALFNHSPNHILGRNRSGTLTLQEDDQGLAVRIEPPEAQWANDVLVSIRRGDISGMSFAFMAEEDLWEEVDGLPLRTLKRVRLMDVSPVTFPAYPQTDIGVAKRSLETWQEERREETVVPDHDLDIKRRRQRLAELQL